MKNKIKFALMVVFMFTLFFIQKPVHAEEYYYTNENGVAFTKEAYDFFSRFVYEGYQKYVTQDEFNEYIEAGIDFENATIEKVGLCSNPTGNNRDIPYFDTISRRIEMSKTCGILCRVNCTVTWHGTPIVQAYDVIGAYLTGPTRLSTPTTIVSSSADSTNTEALVYDTDGFGAVIAVHDASDMVISQSFTYSGHGLIFMSHQHATSNISLANAQLFTIGLSGYGNVFNFYGAATNVYDQMNGVYLTV